MPGLGHRRGEGKAERGRCLLDVVGPFVVHWKQLKELNVRLQFPLFSTEVTQAGQHSSQRAK